jgi:hypothetical protein
LLTELPLPASPSESAPARAADPNEWNFANDNPPHSPLLATERHAELNRASEGLMTDKPTRCELHIEGRVAAERHRQLEVGGQTGDAQAALAAVKLEQEKLLKELGRLVFMVYGRSGHSQLQNQIQIKAICTAYEAFSIRFRVRLSEKWQSRLGR